MEGYEFYIGVALIIISILAGLYVDMSEYEDAGYGQVTGSAILSYGCTDSDGGINPIKPGYAMHTDKAYDYCLDENKLNEAYCDRNDIKYYQYKCPEETICSNGACRLILQ